MHPAQQGRGTPFHEAPAQRRAADPIPGGPQFAPLHAFAQKEPQRFDHRLGGAARPTMIAAWPFDPLNQTGHQAVCRRSHRASPVSITQENWAQAPSSAAAVKAENSSSAAPQTSENRALTSRGGYPIAMAARGLQKTARPRCLADGRLVV